jgi:hypothetical protein
VALLSPEQTQLLTLIQQATAGQAAQAAVSAAPILSGVLAHGPAGTQLSGAVVPACSVAFTTSAASASVPTSATLAPAYSSHDLAAVLHQHPDMQLEAKQADVADELVDELVSLCVG